MKTEELKSFLLAANAAGYASGDLKNRIKESDGSTTITYTEGPWKSVDNYAGGEPYAGATKVSFEGKVEFMMVYYGAVLLGENFNEVYAFLIKALQHMPKDFPYRGPKDYSEGEWQYKNSWTGEVSEFSGEEEIYKNAQKVFWTKYLGGLVDQQIEN